MKRDIRWQLLIAIGCLVLIASILTLKKPTAEQPTVEVDSAEPTIHTDEAGRCTTRMAADGGTLYQGRIGKPQFPIPPLADQNPVDAELADLLFDGLTRYNEQGQIVPALAESWVVSEDGLTITFTLRADAVWHDGKPVTALDAAYAYGLIQDEAFPGDAGLHQAWQTVAINVVDSQTIAFILPSISSPFLELTTRGILPAHLLQGVGWPQLLSHPFLGHPIGTGPLKVAENSNWQEQGTLLLQSNPNGGLRMRLDGLGLRFYADQAALSNAWQSGEIQAISAVPQTEIGTFATLPRVRLFSSADSRYTQLIFNMSESGHPAVRQTPVRQALAYATDQQALITRALNGQGVVLDGPYLPNNAAYDSGVGFYPTNVLSATAALDGAGWLLPVGTAVREQAVDDDEVEITVSAELRLRLLTINDAQLLPVAQELARQWASVGVGVELTAIPYELYAQTLAQRAFDVAIVEIVPPRDPDLYDLWSQTAVVHGHNFAYWSNRRASEALERARQTWDSAERSDEYAIFLNYFDHELPAITLYQSVQTYAISEAVNGVEFGSFSGTRDRYQSLPAWHLLFTEQPVECPPS